jgi:hypothetical protein
VPLYAVHARQRSRAGPRLWRARENPPFVALGSRVGEAQSCW